MQSTFSINKNFTNKDVRKQALNQKDPSLPEVLKEKNEDIGKNYNSKKHLKKQGQSKMKLDFQLNPIESDHRDVNLKYKEKAKEPFSIQTYKLSTERQYQHQPNFFTINFGPVKPTLIQSQKNNVIKKHSLVHKKETGLISSSKIDALGLIKLILHNSCLDTERSPLYKMNGNELEYYGLSPMGGLLTTFYELTSSYSPVLKALLVTNPPGLFKSTSISLVRLVAILPCNRIHRSLIKVSVLKECTLAYFAYFYRFCPIIDEDEFQHSPNPMIKKLVVAIGAKYLPQGEPIPGINDYLDNEILTQFRDDFPKPSIELVKALILMCQFRNVPSEYKNTWLYHSYSVVLAIQLGLHRPAPSKLELTDAQIRLRYHVWWTICIHDKLAFHFTNRPILISSGHWKIEYAPLTSMGILSKDKPQNEFKLAREHLSCHYFFAYCELAELLGHLHGSIRSKYKTDPSSAAIHSSQLRTQINSCYYKFSIGMSSLLIDQPQWVYELAQPLVAQNFTLTQVMILRLSQHFLKQRTHPDFQEHIDITFKSSCLIILGVESLGEYYFMLGVSYLFYAITAACLALASLMQIGDSKVAFQSKLLLKRGLKLLDLSRPYLPICDEFYIRILETAKLTEEDLLI